MNDNDQNNLLHEVKRLQTRITELENIEIAYKKTEAELRKSEEKFRTIFENTGTAMCIIDEDSTILLANARFADLSGYSIDEIAGKISWTTFVIQEDLDRMVTQHKLRRSENNDALRSYEFKLHNKYNETKDILLVIDVIPNTKRSVASLLDITDRKQVEMEARESQQRFKSLFDQAADGILVGNYSGTIVEANNSICQLTGYSQKELVGSNINTLFHEKELNTSPLQYDLIEKGINLLKERNITSKNRESIPIEMSTKVLKDGRIQAIFRDITERKKVQNELIIAKEKAEESDRLKSAFLANMSHEIRTPMNSILGFANLLSVPSLTPEKHQKYVNIIKKSGRRLLETVNDLIDISHIETGQVEVVFDVVNANDVLKILFDMFEIETTKKGLQLNIGCHLPEEKMLMVSDRIKLNSILTNLIKNAIKFTDAGHIEMGCIMKESCVQFYVHDSGIGIPKDRQQAIFNRFEQADIEDRRAMEGSGLGLAIAQAYVEMLGGKIWLESEEKKGSSFYFTIPWQPASSFKMERENTLNKAPLKPETNKLKILIAEDDEVSFQHLSILLDHLANKIIHTASGQEAVEICRANPDINLILMDIKMTEMSGYDATRKIRKFNKTIPIIAQTAYALTGDREKALEAGCTDYLTKPIREQQLMEMIKKLLF